MTSIQMKCSRSNPDIVSVETLAKMLGIDLKRAHFLVNTGEIKSLKIGRASKIAKVHVIS